MVKEVRPKLGNAEALDASVAVWGAWKLSTRHKPAERITKTNLRFPVSPYDLRTTATKQNCEGPLMADRH